MWDPKDRLDADMAYAIRMVQTRCATVEQAARMCGVEPAALRAELARLMPRNRVIGSGKSTQQRRVPRAH
jgi:hypothetical protein